MFAFGRVEIEERGMGWLGRCIWDPPWQGWLDHLWPLLKEYRAVSQRLCQDYLEQGSGRLYAVAQDGLHALTEAAQRARGKLWEDEGLPWCHIRLEAYVPPFSHAHEAHIREALADEDAWNAQPIPDSQSVAAVLRERRFGAVLLIRPNTVYSFARIITCLARDEQVLREERGHSADDENVGECPLSGELEPHYYAWREGEVLVIDRGALDPGT